MARAPTPTATATSCRRARRPATAAPAPAPAPAPATSPGPVLLLLLLLLAAAAHPAAAVRETRLYDVLGCPPDADDRTIKRAYKKAALRWHPDRAEGGDKGKARAEEKFRDVASAYEALSDPDKRRVYDQYGEAGLKRSMGEGGGGGPGGPGGPGGHQFHMQGDPFEMFNMFFGGGGGGGGGMPGGGMPGGGMGGPRMNVRFGGQGGGGGPHMGGRGGGGHGGQGGGGGLYAGDPNVQELAAEDAMPDRAGAPAPRVGEAAVVLAEFYAPWCGHCQQLAEKYKNVGAALSGVVRVVAINCDGAGASVCSSRGVRGYPTIKAWVPGGAGAGAGAGSGSAAAAGRWHDYNGERSAAALSKWAAGLIPSGRSVALKDRADLDALLVRCGGPKPKGGCGGKKAGGGAASSGLCLVLATSKAETPSLWKALSLAYDGAVAFGAARRQAGGPAEALLAAARAANATAADAADASAAAGSDARVVAVCNGDLAGAEMYTGRLKSDALRRFLRGFADGKRCRSRLRLDASTDLSAMGVAQLKALAGARGVTCDGGCLEKGDYIRALKASLAGGAGGGGGAKKDEL